jgi:hypothetical protein
MTIRVPTTWRRGRPPGQALGMLTLALALGACSGAGNTSASARGPGPASHPAAVTATAVRIDASTSPHAQARAIATALNAGKTVSNVGVAVGSQLRWTRPPSMENIYPNEHVVQPLVFGRHLYGYTVAAWTGSMPAPSQEHDVFVQLLRTNRPLLPLPPRAGMFRRHTVTGALRLVPHHPLRGLMPYAVIASIGPQHAPPPPVAAAGLTRDNRR